MDITILRPFTYNGVTTAPGQTINIVEADALTYIAAGKAIRNNQQVFSLPETVRELQVADVLGALNVAQFIFDAYGNVIGLTTTSGATVSFGGPSYTFAGLPTPSSSNAGTSARVTDIGPAGFGSIWSCDGTKWSPLNGIINNLYHDEGSLAAPLVNSGTSGAKMVIPTANGVTSGSIVIPAGLLAKGRRVSVTAKFRKHGTAGTWQVAARLGTTNSASDSAVASPSGAASDNNDLVMVQEAVITGATTMTTAGALVPNQAFSNGMTDRTTNFNTASVMYLGFYIFSLTAGDSVDLISYSVDLKG